MATHSQKQLRIRVDIADYKVGGADGPAILVSEGLGSCVAVALYDPAIRLGGLAHILLPAAQRDERGCVVGDPLKYADTCLQAMLDALEAKGADRARLRAKMAGGATMFPGARGDPRQGYSVAAPAVSVGERNVAAVRALLEQFDVPLVGDDTGGTQGRSLAFDTETGALEVRTARAGRTVV